MDIIELRQSPELFVEWPNGGGFQQVEILINDRSLLDIIYEVELPFARKEFDEQMKIEGERIGESDDLAGDYLYLSPEETYLPAQNFFGEPYHSDFCIEENDPSYNKSLLLSCTCGVIECWFLLADITVNKTTVTWANFQQFHRDWVYDLGPFIFDRQQYEYAFTPS